MEQQHMTAVRCPGTLHRRALVRSSLVGLWSLGLADLLQAESRAAGLPVGTASGARPAGARPTGKSILVLWLWGGPSHMETFDLKPDAPSEYRGEFNPVNTNVPGIRISEHLPLLARMADKFALLRSVHHDSPGHVNSTHTMMTGYKGEEVETAPYRPKYPDFYSVATRMTGDWSRGVPPYLSLPRTRYNGGAHLGGGLDPLIITQDPNQANFKVPDVVVEQEFRNRLARRANLLERFDTTRRMLDHSPEIGTLDSFQQRAISILTSGATRQAFDLSQEDPKLRDRYGRHEVGQRLLLGRRLIEAGSRIVTVDFPCVPGQKAFSWDDHASVWNIFEQMKIRLPVLDQVCSAVIQDLYERGLQNDVLFLVMGEMSHTPKLSNHQGQPGREHWGRSMSVFLSGGGMKMGQVVGETNRLGDEPAERPLTPNDLLATWYRYLGVPLETHFADMTGRPMPILPHGEPIHELLS